MAEKAAGEKTGDICARDIHLATNLQNNYPCVCGTMSSLKLFSYEVILLRQVAKQFLYLTV